MSEQLPKSKMGSRKQPRQIRECVRVGESYCVTTFGPGCLEIKSGSHSRLCYGYVVGQASMVFRAVSPVLLMEWQGKTGNKPEVGMLGNPFLV